MGVLQCEGMHDTSSKCVRVRIDPNRGRDLRLEDRGMEEDDVNAKLK